MSCIRARHRRPLAAAALACWLFALGVSIAHACGLDAYLGDANEIQSMAMSGQGGDESSPPGCPRFCADDVPVLAKIKLVQDQAGAQPLLVSLDSIQPPVTAVPPPVSRSRAPQPPPGIAVTIRFVRLAL